MSREQQGKREQQEQRELRRQEKQEQRELRRQKKQERQELRRQEKQAKKAKQEMGGAGKRRSGKKRRKAPIIIAAVVVLFIIVRAVFFGGSGQAVAAVTTTQAVRGDIQESVSTSGTVSSEQVKLIFAPVSGTLDQVEVAAGDAVKAGDRLVSYNLEKLEIGLKESELQLEKSNAAYNSALADDKNNQWKLYEATHNLEILKQQITDTKAYIKNLENELSKSQRDTSNALARESMELSNKLGRLQGELAAMQPGDAGYEEKQKEIREVNDALSYNSYVTQTASNSEYVSEMQQRIAEAQDMLAGFEEYKAEMEAQKSASEGVVMDAYDKTQQNADKELANISWQETESDYALASSGITADFNGIITECSAVSGAAVSGGTQLMTLESSDNLKVSFSASKSDIEKLQQGQKADVVISGKTYPGEISKINRMAEKNASGTPMVGVEIHLLETDDTIILGMDAKITVYTRKAENTLMVPVEAINADRDGDFLYVVENGTVVRKPVACGISTESYTEILEGISEDDMIIVSSYSNIEEGMAVATVPGE